MKSRLELDNWSSEDEKDKEQALLIVNDYYDKIRKKINNVVTLHIHVKRENENKSGRTNYTIISKFKSPGLFFEASARDWSFVPAVRDSLKTLQREIKKGLEKHSKSRSLQPDQSDTFD